MAIRFNCPSCSALNTVDDDEVGRKVRCRKCDEPIRVPADDEDEEAVQEGRKLKVKSGSGRDQNDDDEDRPDTKPAPAKGGKGVLLLGCGIVAILLLCLVGIGGGTGLYLLLALRAPARAEQVANADAKPPADAGVADFPKDNNPIAVMPKDEPPPDPFPIKPAPKQPNPDVFTKKKKTKDKQKPPTPAPAAGKTILNVNGKLLATSPIDPAAGLNPMRFPQARMKTYSVPLVAGKTYIMSLNSEEFDSYLRLEDPTGKTVAEDDDGGGYPNARIIFRASASGLHRIVATAFDENIGAYHLTVQEGADQIAKGPDPLPPVKGPDPPPPVKAPDPPTPAKGNDPPPPVKGVDPPPVKGKEPASVGPKAAFKQPDKSEKPISYLKIVSSKGDYIGQGKSYDYPGDRLIVRKTPRGIQASVDGWTLEIGAPNGLFLKVGEYMDAKRFAFSGGFPGLDFGGNGRGSNTISGEFVVWELETNGNQIVRLAIDFVQRSEGRGPPLTGKLRISSSFE